MTSYVYDNFSDLPPVGPEEGDASFVKETSSFYSFEDLSVLSSFSYSFDKTSSIFSDDSAFAAIDSNPNFSIDFWSYTFEGNLPYFSLDVRSTTISIFDVSNDSNLVTSTSVNVLPLSPYNIEYDQSLYYNGDALSEVSISPTVNNLSPYTIQFWGRSVSNENSLVASITEDQSILRLSNDNVIVQNVSYQLPENVYNYNTWNHHSFDYDGYDYHYYLNGKKNTLTRDTNYTFAPGDLSTIQFQTEDDASFQTKVIFSSNPIDGTLFLLGEDNGKVELKLTSGGTTLEFQCRDLSISTTDFPKDDLLHIITWEIQVNPKSVKLSIDGELKGSSVGQSAFSENVWVTNGSVEVQPFINSTLSPTDISAQPSWYYYGTRYLNNPTTVSGGSVIVNPSGAGRNPYNSNYGIGSIFYINQNNVNVPLITPNNGNLYYFEMVYNSNGGFQYGYLNPFIAGTQFDWFDPFYAYSNWTGTNNYSYRKGDSELGGINTLNTKDYQYNNETFSFIIDENTNKIYSYVNGSPYGTPDDFSPENMSTGNNTGFLLGFKIGFHSRYNGAERYSLNFNPSTWVFDPNQLYSAVSAPSGGYAVSNNFSSWNAIDNTTNPLHYYPNKIKSIASGSIKNGKNTGSFTTSETGLSYAQKYIATTGGIIRNVSPSDNIYNIIGLSNNGDALVLSPGTYNANYSSLGITDQFYDNQGIIFRGKKILICGSTSNSSDVIVNYTPANGANPHPIFGPSSTGLTQLAFLSFNRISTRTTNYQVALCAFSLGGYAYRVRFDFNNKPVSWLYDNNNLTIKKTFENCVFSNYSTWVGNYQGIASSIVSKNNVFEKNFLDLATLIGTNDDFSAIESNSYSNLEYKGYLKDFSIHDQVLYDSAFSLDSIQQGTDSNTLLFLSGSRSGDTLLGLMTNGDIIINNQVNIDSDYTDDAWIHHALSYDGDKLRVYKDGVITKEISTDFNGYTLSDTVLNIGKIKVIDPEAGDFRDSYYEGNLKDFRLVDSSIYLDSSYIVPTVDRVEESGDIFVTANTGNVTDTDVLSIEGNIQSTLFSPYTSSERGWIKTGISARNWIDVYINNDQIEFDYDSNVFLDSFAFSAILSFDDKDDAGSNIRWDYEANQIIPQFDVYRDSSSTNFYLKRIVNSGDYIPGSSIFTFTATRTSGDSNGKFFFIPKNDEYFTDQNLLMIEADNFRATNIPITSPFNLSQMVINLVDSNTDLSGYVLDSSDRYSIFANDINARLYESSGEFL